MNRKARVTAGLLTAGVLGVGALAVAAPAIAGNGSFGSPMVAATDDGRGPGGYGNGMGPGGMGTGGLGPGGMGMSGTGGPGMGLGGAGGPGMGAGDGACGMLLNVPSGTLTDAQKRTLAAMAEEEKLAGDLYRAFAEKYPAAIFSRIAVAEDRHLAAVRTLLTRYALTDPTAGKAAGQFTTAATKATYDRLLAQGLRSEDAALAVGQQVEKADVAELQSALTRVTAADVRQVYQHLLNASRQHLTAFTTWSDR
jgi:hypothetical protein